MKTDKEFTIGEILKSEADPNSRELIAVAHEVEVGDFVVANGFSIALSRNVNGKVLYQKQNCVYDLSLIDEEFVAACAARQNRTVENIKSKYAEWKSEWKNRGIRVINGGAYDTPVQG